jgi:hypothetical protein
MVSTPGFRLTQMGHRGLPGPQLGKVYAVYYTSQVNLFSLLDGVVLQVTVKNKPDHPYESLLCTLNNAYLLCRSALRPLVSVIYMSAFCVVSLFCQK